MKYAVGLMSGTSLDGVDAALVQFDGGSVELLEFTSIDIEDDLRDRILNASHPDTSNVALICALNVELGSLFSKAVQCVLDKAEFKGSLDFVASHGQTLYHAPSREGGNIASTLQVGDPSQIAFDHDTQVVFNFRMMDMVAGGDGAPLVPLTEYILYRSEDKSRLLQNIGGIGNVTIIPKGAGVNDISAFDTGPGNMMMNAAVSYYYDEAYDRDGLYGAKGKLIPELFESLCSIEYLKQVPPKSTGRELFGEDFVQRICDKYPNADDVIHTLTKFTAYSIADSYEQFVFPNLSVDEIVVGGGGAYNPTLMSMIKEYLPNHSVLVQEDLGYSSDAKEAIAFAILGNETLSGRFGNVPNATGASRSVILGQIQPRPWK